MKLKFLLQYSKIKKVGYGFNCRTIFQIFKLTVLLKEIERRKGYF